MGENQVKIGHILMAHCNPAHASLAIVFADIFPEKGFSINLEHVARNRLSSLKCRTGNRPGGKGGKSCVSHAANLNHISLYHFLHG